MKKQILRLIFLFLPLALLLSASGCQQNQDPTSDQASSPTVVYLVRHAEKLTDNPAEEDPDLAPAGYQRAEDLKAYLAGQEIQALFSTAYRRNRQTVAPLSRERGLDIQFYEGHDFEAMAEKINREYAGQTVVVAAHSNTVLELVEAFGTKRPREKIADHEYHYLFRVVKEGNQPATVEVVEYGQRSEEPVEE